MGLASRIAWACVAILACLGLLRAQPQESDEKGRLLIQALTLSQEDPEGAFRALSGIQGSAMERSDAPLFKQIILNLLKSRPLEAMELFLRHEPIFLAKDDPGFFLEIAGRFEKAGLEAKALELYEKAYSQGVKKALVPLMGLLESLGNWDRILAFEPEIAKTSLPERDQRELSGILGNAFLKKGKPKEAITEILQAQPTFKNYLRRGVAFMDLGHPDSADEAFSLALSMALNQNNSEGLRRVILLKAQNLEKAKRYAQAASHWALYLKKFPKDPFLEWARLRLGVATLDAGDPKKARSWLLPLTKSQDKGISEISRALIGFLDTHPNNFSEAL